MFQAKNYALAGLALSVIFLALPASAASAKRAAAKVATVPDRVKVAKPYSGAGDPIVGKGKSELCQGCHGEDGNSPDSMTPKLAGQNASYIAKQLRNYQVGTRTHQIMSAMATTVSDGDLGDIAPIFPARRYVQNDRRLRQLSRRYRRRESQRQFNISGDWWSAQGLFAGATRQFQGRRSQQQSGWRHEYHGSKNDPSRAGSTGRLCCRSVILPVFKKFHDVG